MSKKLHRLIVLSDLWGNQNNEWLQNYFDFLSPHFHWTDYDSTQLAELDAPDFSQEERHQFFVETGIDRAVSNLRQLAREPTFVLAFSIGGTIAWKAALKSDKLHALYAISATRLRYEKEAPPLPLKLVFGEKDFYRPSDQWSANKNLDHQLVPDASHELYKQSHFSDVLKKDALRFFQSISE